MREAVALFALVTTVAFAGDYVPYVGRSCPYEAESDDFCVVGSDVGLNLTREDARSGCWNYCDARNAVAAYTLEEVCCCSRNCSCLVHGSNETLLAIAADASPRGDCAAGVGYDQFVGWDCGEETPRDTFSLSPGGTASERSDECWLRCGRTATTAAVSDPSLECRCYSNCTCFVATQAQVVDNSTLEENTVCAMDSTATPPYRCQANETVRVFARVDCAEKEPAVRIFGADATAWCWDECAARGTHFVAASVNDTRCDCLTECSCLEVQLTSGNQVHLSAASEEQPPDCEAGLTVFDASLYAQYESYAGVQCSDASPKRTCLFDLDYSTTRDPVVHRYECFAFCAQFYQPFFRLDAAYGDPQLRECCCVEECDCFQAPSDDTGSAVLALAFNNASRPQTCSSSRGNNKKSQLAPGLDASDVWWVVVLCVVGFVAVAFFVKVEEIDKLRRRRADEKVQAAKPDPRKHHDDDDEPMSDSYDDDDDGPGAVVAPLPQPPPRQEEAKESGGSDDDGGKGETEP
mmetsp:Transcript_7572/g.23389  ORF Transcript_7572/g.23389 Transcript_7572/m.23389 type:complete len:520 (-) Transcript_7572:238-1797(-)